MIIQDIYHKTKIPKNLARHMLRVAAVGQHLARNWPTQIDSDAIIETLLFHDLGNILKFDLKAGIELFDEDEQNVAYWTSVRDDMAKKYSPDEHVATLLLAQEFGLSQRSLTLLQNMGSSNLSKTLSSSDWELKICAYSDFRVGPFGFLTVEERFADILKRYEGREHVLADKQATLQKMAACQQLESQLQEMVNIDLQLIDYDDLEKGANSLSGTEVRGRSESI